MSTTRILSLPILALVLATPPAHAGDPAKPEATRLGEHPAVVVARRGVRVDPTANFYLHPARLSWTLQRPQSEGAEPLLVGAHGERNSAIDPRRDAVAPSALGTPSAATPLAARGGVLAARRRQQ
jgi:hypothetical protein